MGKGQNYRMSNFPFKCCTSKQKVSLHPPLLRVQLSGTAAGLWVSSYTAEMCAFGGGGLAGIAFFSFFICIYGSTGVSLCCVQARLPTTRLGKGCRFEGALEGGGQDLCLDFCCFSATGTGHTLT